MTRMWLTDTPTLCRDHLLGEHKELHQLVGAIKAKRWSVLEGHAKKGQIETRSIHSRHEAVVAEFAKRGWKHKSPLPAFPAVDIGRVDVQKNIEELMQRCSNCRLLITPTLKPSAEEVWLKSKPLVFATVKAFKKRYGGDFQELAGEAQVAFMKAYHSYNPKPDQKTGDYHIGGWIKYIIWNRLKDSLGTRLHREWILPRTDLAFKDAEEYSSAWDTIPERDHFELHTFIKELSQEAQDAIKFALTNPYGSPYKKQITIARLLQDLGWAGRQILNAFNEVREALMEK